MLFGQYKEAAEGLVASFSKDESKKHEVQMYDKAFKITDKPLDLSFASRMKREESERQTKQDSEIQL